MSRSTLSLFTLPGDCIRETTSYMTLSDTASFILVNKASGQYAQWQLLFLLHLPHLADEMMKKAPAIESQQDRDKKEESKEPMVERTKALRGEYFRQALKSHEPNESKSNPHVLGLGNAVRDYPHYRVLLRRFKEKQRITWEQINSHAYRKKYRIDNLLDLLMRQSYSGVSPITLMVKNGEYYSDLINEIWMSVTNFLNPPYSRDLIRDNRGMTFLHWMCILNMDISIVAQAINLRYCLSEKDHYFKTPLQYIVENENVTNLRVVRDNCPELMYDACTTSIDDPNREKKLLFICNILFEVDYNALNYKTHVKLYGARAHYYFKNTCFNEALQDRNKVLAIHSQHPLEYDTWVTTIKLKAETLCQLGKKENLREAIECYKIIVETAPTDPHSIDSVYHSRHTMPEAKKRQAELETKLSELEKLDKINLASSTVATSPKRDMRFSANLGGGASHSTNSTSSSSSSSSHPTTMAKPGLN